jgi:hypothetical protein
MKLLINCGIIIMILPMFAGCERLNDSAGFREPYLGNFSFSSYSYSWSTYNGGYRYFDTLIHIGSVEFDRIRKDYIIINYRPENSGGYTCSGLKVYGTQIVPRILESGVLIYPEDPNICRTSKPVIFDGRFIGTDSIHFSIGSGSQGANFGQIVSGKRIK